MGASRIGGLLGSNRESLDGRDRIGREWGGRRAGRCGAAAGGAQLSDLLAQLTHERARLIGALMLVLDRALERLELGVRVGNVAGEHALLLDAIAGQRLQLGAYALELGAQPLLLVSAGTRVGDLGNKALVALRNLAQLLVALSDGLGQGGCQLLDSGPRPRERAAQ